MKLRTKNAFNILMDSSKTLGGGIRTPLVEKLRRDWDQLIHRVRRIALEIGLRGEKINNIFQKIIPDLSKFSIIFSIYRESFANFLQTLFEKIRNFLEDLCTSKMGI